MLNNRLQRENLHTSESASEPQKGTQPLLVQPGRGESVSGQSSAGNGHTSAGEEEGAQPPGVESPGRHRKKQPGARN